MYDVVTIGSATRDNFLLMDYDLINWPKSPSKKAVVFNWGEKYGVDRVYSTLGGNAANASVTFARQGFRAACVAKIGSDIAGDEFLAYLKSHKVDVSLIANSEDLPTAYSALLLGKTGERTILNYHGASDTFKLKDLKLNKMKARWWYVSLSGASAAMYPALIAYAKKNGIKVAFNPSGYHLKRHKQAILDSLKDLAFLVLNKGEAADLVGISFDNPKIVFQKLDALMPGIVAVTDGPNGVMVSDGKNIYRAGIFKEKVIVDRTGAGDSFGSGFVAGLMQRENVRSRKLEVRRQTSNIQHPTFDIEDIKYAIRLASANATANVEVLGPTEGLLTKREFLSDPRWKSFKIDTRPL